MTLVGHTQTHSQPRETNATIDEVVYYGDMTYYDLRLDGAAAMDGKARPVRISMRNVFGRDVQEVGTRTRLAWSPGSLVLFR
jgi:spermidine/putrescine transport system ATP-binding protein